ACAKSFLAKRGAKESIRLQKISSDREVKELLSSVDPYTIGLLIGGGIAMAGIWIAYQVTKEQSNQIKNDLGINK
ncbi:MAG: hypothetical protein P8X70_03165, partial [Nanoarchaeota archaeon]